MTEETIPRLETKRLILRPHRAEDLAAAADLWADPGVVRFIGGKPSSRPETWTKLLRYRGLWELLGYGYWAVEEKATGAFLGDAGLADFKRDLTPSIEGVPEIGIALTPKCHGNGYATEALTAVLEWSDRTLAATRTVCIYDPGNQASAKLIRKLGYREVCLATIAGEKVHLYERPKSR